MNDYYKQGICFLCGEPCNPTAMIHLPCATARMSYLEEMRALECAKNKGTVKECGH